jgi:hypothetical protein
MMCVAERRQLLVSIALPCDHVQEWIDQIEVERYLIQLENDKLIHGAIIHVPLTILKYIKNTTQHYLLAWHNSNLADWDPPPLGSFKVNFDVAIRPTFAVAASEKFLTVNTLKLPPMDALMGEAHAALLASRLAVSMGCSPLIIEGDSLLTILALKDPLLFSD